MRARIVTIVASLALSAAAIAIGSAVHRERCANEARACTDAAQEALRDAPVPRCGARTTNADVAKRTHRAQVEACEAQAAVCTGE